MPDPGWYDDPEDQTQLRWWDGARWTDRRQPRDVTPPPPPPPPPSAGAAYGIPLGGPADGPADGPATSGPSAWDAPSAHDAGPWGTPGAVASGSVLTAAAPPRTFWEAIKVCLTKYVDGKGRASRSEYWYFALFTFLVNVVTAGLGSLFLLLPGITVSVRRLHDIGKSAWTLLWVIVPFVGPFVLLYYAVKPGEPNMNRFG